MKKQKALKPKQQLAVKLFALGEPQKIIAERLEVSVMTIYRWQHIPAFQTQLESLHSSGLEATAKKIHIAGITAAETIQEFLNDMAQPAEVRAKFAVGVLRAYPAFQAALAKGLSHRIADFTLDERWAMNRATYDSCGNLIAEKWAKSQPQVVDANGGVAV